MASSTAQGVTTGVTREGCPLYRSSHTYRLAWGFGRRLSLWALSVFAWADRCLENSLLYRGTLSVAHRLEPIFSSSLFAKWVWPYAKMALAPYGQKVTVETALGLVLALCCVAPTELVMLASAGVLILMLWDKCRAARLQVRPSLQAPSSVPVRSSPSSRSALPVLSSLKWVFPPFGMLVSVATFLLFIVGATVSSAVPSLSIFNLALWLLYFLIFLMAVDASSRERAVQVIWPFLTGAAFSGLVGVYQMLAGGSVMPSHWVDQAFEGNLVRVVGTFTNPIFLGEMMALALPLTLALFLLRQDWQDRLVLIGFAVLQALGLLLSSTRGAWLGFAVSFCALAVLYDWRMLPIGAALGASGLSVAPPVLIQRLVSSFSLADTSNAYRISIWRGSVAIIKEHLWRGIGLGAEVFRRVYPEYQIIQTPTPHAHSTLLELLIEVGLPGFLALVCFFWLWLRDATDAVLSQQGNRNRRWARIGVLAACLAGVAGHMVHGLIDYTWYNPRVASVFWAIVGIGAGMASSILRKVNPVQTTDVDALRAGEDNLENVVGNPLDAAAGTLERTLENQGISGESGSS